MTRKPVPEIVSHALELFAPLGVIRVKPMFGGYGFYCDELFFALVAADTLYLKADQASSDAFREAGSEPFRYTRGDGQQASMGYWSAPEESLDGPLAMQPWARSAMACALRRRKTPPRTR